MLYLFIYVDQGRWAATTSRTISEASMRFPWDDWDTIRSRDRNVNGWSDGPDGTRSSTRGSTPGPMARHVLGAPTSRRAPGAHSLRALRFVCGGLVVLHESTLTGGHHDGPYLSHPHPFLPPTPEGASHSSGSGSSVDASPSY